MKTKRNQKHGPLVMRLMMATVFLPVVSVLLVIWFTQMKLYSFANFTTVVLGFFPIRPFYVTCLIVIPILCVLLVLWKGMWRTAMVTVTASFLLICVTNSYETCAPEKREIFINVNNIVPKGTKVYCNGILLGEAPLGITVEELKAKVPEWSTPPEQKWFVNRTNPVYTWFPWDRFTKERYDEYRFLEDNRSSVELDMQSKYWWQFESNGMTYCFCEQRWEQKSQNFEDILYYPELTTIGSSIPAERALLDVLVTSLKTLDDSEKRQWAQYVTTLPPIMPYRMNLAYPKNTDVQEALDLAARLRYGLSDSPTPEECRRTIATILEENDKSRMCYSYGGSWLTLGETFYLRGGTELTVRAVKQMGDACREPLARAFRENKYHDIDGEFAPLVYAAGFYRFPDMFDEQTKYFASTYAGFHELLSNHDERTLPLFHTLMNNKLLMEYTKSGKQEAAANKIRALGVVDNTALEPHIRDYVTGQLQNTLEDDPITAEEALNNFVNFRLSVKPEEWADIRQWVENLRINPALKRPVMQTIRRIEWLFHPESGTIFIGLPDSPSLRVQTLSGWLDAHPDKSFGDFFAENYPDLSDETLKHIQETALRSIMFDDSQPSEAILKKMWDNPVERRVMLRQFPKIFEPVVNILTHTENSQIVSRQRDQNVQLPGLYYNILNNDDTVNMTSKVNAELVRIFDEIDDTDLCRDFLRIARGRETTGLAKLVEKWSESDDPQLAEAANDAIAAIQMRERIREQSRELFLQIVAGEMTPDDLLPESEPWVWHDGKYVRKSTIGQ